MDTGCEQRFLEKTWIKYKCKLSGKCWLKNNDLTLSSFDKKINKNLPKEIELSSTSRSNEKCVTNDFKNSSILRIVAKHTPSLWLSRAH